MNSLSSSTAPSKVNKTYNKDPADFITINEKVNLTKDQHEVLNIICDINDRHRIYQEQETPIDQLFKRTTGISVSHKYCKTNFIGKELSTNEIYGRYECLKSFISL